MKNVKVYILPLLLLLAVMAALLYGCATGPIKMQSVENARSEYQQAAQNKEIKQNASVALYEAEQQLQKLNNAIAAGADEAELDHLAYLVQQRVDIAKAVAQRKMAANEIDQLNKERTQILMDQRRAEVRRAEQKAATLQQELEKIQASAFHEEPRGTVITLSDVFFDFGKATLKSGATRNLDALVRFLKENPQRNVVIEGFTDSVGSPSYNQQLSQMRSRAVIGYLESRGISRDRLTARGYGAAFPVATNQDSAGRQLNRRVEIVVLREGQQPAELTAFSEMDRDNNGYLTKEETRQMQPLSSDFEKYDQNRDEQLSPSEFSAFEDMEIQQQQNQRSQGRQ
jgi:outer membrane protein OmpA-like peptidoglycan-associated protein